MMKMTRMVEVPSGRRHRNKLQHVMSLRGSICEQHSQPSFLSLSRYIMRESIHWFGSPRARSCGVTEHLERTLQKDVSYH